MPGCLGGSLKNGCHWHCPLRQYCPRALSSPPQGLYLLKFRDSWDLLSLTWFMPVWIYSAGDKRTIVSSQIYILEMSNLLVVKITMIIKSSELLWVQLLFFRDLKFFDFMTYPPASLSLSSYPVNCCFWPVLHKLTGVPEGHLKKRVSSRWGADQLFLPPLLISIYFWQSNFPSTLNFQENFNLWTSIAEIHLKTIALL